MRYLFCISLVFLFTAPFSISAQQVKLQNGLALKYVVREPQKKLPNPPVVIMLHGYGSNEQDLFDIRQFIPDSFVVISARAPYPLSERGYQWFERDKSQQRYDAVKEQLENSRQLLLRFIQQATTKYHTNASRIYVMGFSQGAIMSYAAGLASPASMRGIGILSGILPQAIKPKVEKSAALSRLKIFITHGTADNILAYADGKAASDYLMGIGLHPEFHSYANMPHTISREVLDDLLLWLKK